MKVTNADGSPETDFAYSGPHPCGGNKGQTKVLAGHRIGLANESRNIIIRFIPKTYLRDDCNEWRFTAVAGDNSPFTRRCVMRKFIAALALISLIAIPTLTQTANAAPVSPSSSSFGSNGY
jgi:hypothetical protein